MMATIYKGRRRWIQMKWHIRALRRLRLIRVIISYDTSEKGVARTTAWRWRWGKKIHIVSYDEAIGVDWADPANWSGTYPRVVIDEALIDGLTAMGEAARAAALSVDGLKKTWDLLEEEKEEGGA